MKIDQKSKSYILPMNTFFAICQIIFVKKYNINPLVFQIVLIDEGFFADRVLRQVSLKGSERQNWQSCKNSVVESEIDSVIQG